MLAVDDFTTSPPGTEPKPWQPERPGLHYTHEGNNLSQEEGSGGSSTSEPEGVADGAGSAGEERRGSGSGGGGRSRARGATQLAS